LKLGKYKPLDEENAKARRQAEEQYRNQKAQAEAQKADLIKKQRKIQECQEQIRRMDRYAERALMEGQEKKAGIYLERKLEWENRLAAWIEDAGFAVTDTSSCQPCESGDQRSEKTE